MGGALMRGGELDGAHKPPMTREMRRRHNIRHVTTREEGYHGHGQHVRKYTGIFVLLAEAIYGALRACRVI